jgi:hypothetical protein
VKRIGRSFTRLTCAAVLFAVAVAGAADAHECQRSQRQKLWNQLDAAREYRAGFPKTKVRDDLIGAYPDAAGTLISLEASWKQYLDNPDPRTALEATCGFRETLNEIMAGDSLLGNQKLMQGLRTRYPGLGDPEDPDQTTLLTGADGIFRGAVELAGDDIRQWPERMRSRGTANPDFPFYVENTPQAPGSSGEIVESEYFRFTNLLIRYGLAGNSLGKRMFFFGNADEGARAEAAAVFQRTGQAIYLDAALLAAAQSPDDFQNNVGAEVKRQVSDAQQVFDDIRAGFNPLTLRGDFVPYQSTDNLLAGLKNVVESAGTDEQSAKDLTRRYDTDQTALHDELLHERENYVDQLEILLGVVVNDGDATCDPPDQNNCDLTVPEDREKILALAKDPVYLCGPRAASDELDCTATAEEGACDKTICNNYRAYAGAEIDLREARRELFNVFERVRIEEERSETVAQLVTDTGIAVSVLDVAQGVAAAAIPDISSKGELHYSPGAAVEGVFEAGKNLLETIRDSEIEHAESAATIKNLMLDEATQAINVERVALAKVEAYAEYTASIDELVRFMRNAVSARENLAEAYYNNPAYRLQLDLTQQEADRSFEAGMVSAYESTKALEYEWAERLQNPVLRLDGRPAEPIGGGSKYDAIERAESAFALGSAGNPARAPTLQTYVEALQQWDIKMRQRRAPERQAGQTKIISLKRDILGFDTVDEAFNRLAFRDYIAKHRVPGSNPDQDDLIVEFPAEIADQRLLPAQPNLKIVSLGVNLTTVPGRTLRPAGSQNSNPPLIDLTMYGQAMLRTFFADYPTGDDLLALKLEQARTFRQSHFTAQVEATIDGGGTAAPNTQLANRSPAVSRWQLRIEGDITGSNDDLILENLADIEIEITYTFGKPPEFTFPVFNE